MKGERRRTEERRGGGTRKTDTKVQGLWREWNAKKREESEGKGRVAGRGAREEEGRWTRKKGEMKRER